MEYCIHEMLALSCAICLRIEPPPTPVADEDFYCGQCSKMVWRGEHYTLKMTRKDGLLRRRKVGGCCSDE